MSNKKVDDQSLVTIEMPKSLIEKIVNKYIEENINEKGEFYINSQRLLDVTNKEVSKFIEEMDF